MATIDYISYADDTWGGTISTTTDHICHQWCISDSSTDSTESTFGRCYGVFGSQRTRVSVNSYQLSRRAETEMQRTIQDSYSRHANSYQQTFKGWIQENLLDRIQQLYVDNQRKIEMIWQEMIAEELRQEKEKAERTAKAMLLDIIGEEEYKVYEETGQLLVKGRMYDYLLNKHGNVKRVTKDKVINLCVHLKERYKYPETDNIISLAMNFKFNENYINRTAHEFRVEDKGTLPKAANF